MKIEIQIEKLDKTIAGLVRAMGDEGFEGIVTRETISFESQEPDEWVKEERIKAFEAKYNEDIGNENVFYKVTGVMKKY